MEVFKNILQRDQEIFESFLLDQMSDSEKATFKAKLEADPNLKDSFEEFKRMFRAVEEANLRSKLNEYHAEIIGNDSKIRKLKPEMYRYRYL